MEVKDIALGNLFENISGNCVKKRGNLEQSSSYINQKETSVEWGYSRSSIFFDRIFIGRFIDQGRKQVFHQEFQTCGIHGMMIVKFLDCSMLYQLL